MLRTFFFPRSPRLAALLLFSSAAFGQNLIQNGGFESPGTGSIITLSAGDTRLAPWSVVSGQVDVTTSIPNSGRQLLDISGFVPGAIEQTFSTVVGQAYKLSFYMTGPERSAPEIKRVEVNVAGQSQIFSYDTTATPLPVWQLRELAFTATATSTTLRITSVQNEGSPHGAYLDDVSVVATGAPKLGRRLVVITHGFRPFGGFPSWVRDMADEIVARAGDKGKIIKFYHDDAKASVVYPTSDHQVTLAPDGPTIVIYDWSNVSDNLDGAHSIPGWREAAGDLLANFLLGSNLVREANNPPAGDPVPVHFIAHSFGTVVNSEAIRRLYFEGIKVEQMTTLDPHDQNQENVPDAWDYSIPRDSEAGGAKRTLPFDEPAVAVWRNVAFADNYWQDNVGDRFNRYDGGPWDLPVGHPLTNAQNENLTSRTYYRPTPDTEDPSDVDPHSLVWAWYFRSILGNHHPTFPEDTNLGWPVDPMQHTEQGFAFVDPARRTQSFVGAIPDEPPSIFNGDFELHIDNEAEIPGYRPTGVLFGEITKNVGGFHSRVGWIRNGGWDVNNNLAFEHAPIWVPAYVSEFVFDLFVEGFEAGSRLIVEMSVPGGLSSELELAGSEMEARRNQWGQPVSLPVAPYFRGKWVSVKIQLSPSGSNSILIDNLRLGPLAALVRHAPVLSASASIDGSVRMLTGEPVSLSGSSWISGDLFAPGTPAVSVTGAARYGGDIDAAGNIIPAGYPITLSDTAVLRHVVRRKDSVTLPIVAAPPAPAGTRIVSLTNASQNPGDFATIRDLSLNANAGSVSVPPGTYGHFRASGNSAFVLGVPGATAPVVYDFQSLALNVLPGNARILVVSPVVVTVASGPLLNGVVGDAARPESLVLRVTAGVLSMSRNARLNAQVIAPNSLVELSGNAVLRGTVIADQLKLNGSSAVIDPAAP